MQLSAAIDGETLISKATRYLAVVEVFRAERCEPAWRPELPPRDSVRPGRPSRRSGGRRPHASRP